MTASHGMMRVAAAAPPVAIADCRANTEAILDLLQQAESEAVELLVLPELAITGYTCADLFHHETLRQAAVAELIRLVAEGAERFRGVAVVGVPLMLDGQTFNCAVVFSAGRILGVVPKSYIPNYKEFYERRWFAPAKNAVSDEIQIGGGGYPFGPDLLFRWRDDLPILLGVEICEDLWVPVPPSCLQAIRGATILANLSASNELIGKWQYRRDLVLNQSGRCLAAYVYASCGVTESTTDVVFGGHCMIAENASMLQESQRFQRRPVLITADVDIERLLGDRARLNSFGDSNLYREEAMRLRIIDIGKEPRPLQLPLRRRVDPHPFVPSQKTNLEQRCQEIFQMQVAGLAKRLEHIGKPPVTIGVSGGLDSTLALLVTCKTFDSIECSRERIQAITMPGFGTGKRTLANARSLMQVLGVSGREIDIRAMALAEMQALGHKPFGIDLGNLSLQQFLRKLQEIPPEQMDDLVFENVQARLRTMLLMNTGFVVGTGDLSELALGWCTYNGDHASMYNPNCSIPKTLVRFLVDWVARHEFTGKARDVLLDIVATRITPELLPTRGGQVVQDTEAVIGPYELHDFYLYYFMRFGFSPEKILLFAEHASFDRPYPREEMRRWLAVFIKRFFANQFKRSFLPDGPKVGTVSLSPRGDWRMPSDAAAATFLAWADAQ